MTQEQVAQRAGIIQGTVSAIERDVTSAPLGPNLLRLAHALECSPAWLQTGKGPVSSSATEVTESEFATYTGGLSKEQKQVLLDVAKTLFK
jgi:transcriptional regulator with XRE-family HTH domain